MPRESDSPSVKPEQREVEAFLDYRSSHQQVKHAWRPYLEAKLGFRNHWYPAPVRLRARLVTSPEPVKMLGERIVAPAGSTAASTSRGPLRAPTSAALGQARMLYPGDRHLLVSRLHLQFSRRQISAGADRAGLCADREDGDQDVSGTQKRKACSSSSLEMANCRPFRKMFPLGSSMRT